MILFKVLRFSNFLSFGKTPAEIQLDKHQTNLIIGRNGAGKCVRGNTKIDIDIENEEIRNKFVEFISKNKFT
jgi:predicted ATPase